MIDIALSNIVPIVLALLIGIAVGFSAFRRVRVSRERPSAPDRPHLRAAHTAAPPVGDNAGEGNGLVSGSVAAAADVMTLRSLADCRAIIARAQNAGSVMVIGASFIGLEVAAALRTRGLEVHVVAPEARPMERILGPQFGDLIRGLHEEKGVRFHLENAVSSFKTGVATLQDGTSVKADFAVMGVGVRPRLQLAEAAGLTLDRGVSVNRYLQTSAPDIYAAGDIARWPDRTSGSAIRVEHWVVATRQGQTAARNMLGLQEEFAAAPFFWSQHYDLSINYVGHAESWDALAVEGDLAARDGLVRFNRGGRTLAVASLFRDIESLKAEAAMEESALKTGS